MKRFSARFLPIALLLGAALLFSIANRGAYKSYFQADSLDNLALAKSLTWMDLAKPLVIPKVFVDNFRPIGILFYKIMGRTAGLWFPPYAAALQALHIVNVALLFLLLRRLGMPFLAACAGSLFFAFHMALFSVYWEPMFVFDLLCGTMCLLSLLSYVGGHWIVSLVLFWLAYRTKENAIMLPAVLLAYEFLLGQRRWKRLIPFFALALLLGVQGLIHNAARDSAYTLRFDAASVWKCISFYSSELLLIPFAGLAIVFVPLLVRDRRMWFGFAAFCALMVPMLVLPGRLFAAYLYVPIIAAAVTVAALAAGRPRIVLAALLLLWIPWNYVNLRRLRNTELARADVVRRYIATLVPAAQSHPEVTSFLYHDLPMEPWAISGAVSFVRSHAGPVRVLSVDGADAAKILQSGEPLMVLDWDSWPPPGSVVALVRTPKTPDATYIAMDRTTPLWQFESGWYLEDHGPYRWMRPCATARLARPAGAKQFEVTLNASPAIFRYISRSHFRVLLNGGLIGERDLDKPGLQVLRCAVDAAPAGRAEITFEAQPGFRISPDADLLAMSVGGFGFVTQ